VSKKQKRGRSGTGVGMSERERGREDEKEGADPNRPKASSYTTLWGKRSGRQPGIGGSEGGGGSGAAERGRLSWTSEE
jgi:hypothetical protein